jgi:hypothetical protein
MDVNRDDIAGRIGKAIATIFVILLLAMFAYGYLAPYLSG